MFKKILFISSLFLLICSSIKAQTVDEILAKLDEAYGTKKAFDAIKTMKIAATMEVQGMEIPITYISIDTSKIYLKKEIKDKKIILCANDKDSWFDQGDGKAQDIPLDQVSDFKHSLPQQAGLFSKGMVNLKKDSNKVEYAGKEKVDDKTCFKLIVTDTEGQEFKIFVDTKTNYPLKLNMKREIQGQEAEIDIVLTDNKKINGLVFPHKVEIFADGTSVQTFKFDKIELNTAIDEKIFAKPESKPESTPEPKK
jgi:hypothetical protein